MPSVSVTLNKTDIIAKVRKAAAFVAKEAYRDENSLYDSIRITDQDSAIIEDFFDEAKHRLISVFGDECSGTTTGVTFNLSGNYQPALEGAIIQESQEYVFHSCCRRWFLLRYAPKVEEYSEKVGLNLDNLKVILYVKKAPVRESGNTFNGGLIRIGEQATE